MYHLAVERVSSNNIIRVPKLGDQLVYQGDVWRVT
jgi:hypothetical protein